LALATWRGFPWRKVPGQCFYSRHPMLRLQLALLTAYIFAQVMGGVVGAALVYANYFHAIDIFEGGRGIRTLKTASLFSTYAVSVMIIL